ncbi:MAG: preprotein translocase subunit SecA [Chloroflexi bacterium]|nr:preprotein translocase subunit SecA [Chloroflexota bacterium]
MGLLDGAKKIIGDANRREIGRLQKVAAEINAWEPEIARQTDADLRAKTAEFRARLADGADLDGILTEAFAVVREASKRWLQMRHFDVQLIGGIVLHQGKIAEMRTGEGKTLVATLAVYLNALEGDGVHVITVNDYLAKRDARWMGVIYQGLGLSVGVLQHGAAFLFDPDYEPGAEDGEEENATAEPGGSEVGDVTAEERAQRAQRGDMRFLRPVPRSEAYGADITYGTNNEYGFDYLRDNMATEAESRVQRPLAYGIVDEVDNILIDEARTPLIISGQAEESLDLYRTFARIAPQLREGADLTVELKSRTVALTEAGIEKVEAALGIDNLFAGEHARLTRFLEAALRAQFVYHRDRDYVVRNGQVMIVDEFTGRLMEGRRYAEGLHQAIEAKEGVKVQRETVTLATITYQNYFRLYGKLAGMTGTAATEAEEMHKIYALDVVVIPTHQPMIRDDHPDVIYRSESAKFKAVVDEIAEVSGRARPVLVGTVAVETSERLSEMLTRRGVKHEVLNAKQHEREAQIVLHAGEPGAVTIATNMAGRGTDIKLGAGVADRGGLHVIGTERHEARRIDNQLRGRSGRQGDPGSSRFFVSFEDTIMRRFTPDWLPGMLAKLGMDDGQPLESGMVGKAIEQAQQKVEGHYFDTRKHLVEYDDVVNRQRAVIYAERDKVLAGEDLKAIIVDMIETELQELAAHFSAGGPGAGDEEGFWAEAATLMPLDDFDRGAYDRGGSALAAALVGYALAIYDDKERDAGADVMRRLERFVLLRTIDRLWVQHLTELDSLRQGVGLQAYGQQDPLVTYKREAFDMFDQLTANIRGKVTQAILQVQRQEQGRRARGASPGRVRPAPAAPTAAGGVAQELGVRNVRESGGGVATQAPTRRTTTGAVTSSKIGRNDPCPCGSGKKHKKCHGAA